MPLGFRFSPMDSELMPHLWNKIRNPSDDHPAVTVHDFYSQEPWLLPWDSSKNRFFHCNECYFFLRRDNGTRPKRAVDSGRGWWNADTTEDKQGRGNRKREGTKTDWIMHDLYHQKSVKEWVLCRIRYNGKDPLQPEPQQCVGPDLQLPPFCLGPDSQLRTSSKPEKIGVAAKRVQEQYAPTLYNEEIQETREMINNTGFEWSEVVVGGVHQEPMVEKDCWFQQQQQPAEPLEEYDAKELKIDSEALVVSPLQQRKREQTLENCDDNFAKELEPKLVIKSEPAEQPQPLQQAPEENAEGDCDEKLLENFDFSQLPLDNKEFDWMEKEFGARSSGDLWDDQVWYWMGEEY